MKNEIPCKNCLTYAVCRAQILELDNGSLEPLIKKCSLLTEHIFYIDNTLFSSLSQVMRKYRNTYEILNGKKEDNEKNPL